VPPTDVGALPTGRTEAFSRQAGGEECAIHAEWPPIAVSQSLGAQCLVGRRPNLREDRDGSDVPGLVEEAGQL
jgi:hypothetical protein